jgi:nucleoid-associated protein YgaU
VVTKAQEIGSPNAAQALAVTAPKITIDQTGISFKLRQAGAQQEFSFDFGTLRITLSQEVFIASDLSECERRKWAAHEQGHVNDNRTVMDNLEAEFMQDGFIQDVFVNGKWFPRTDFQLVQKIVEGAIGDVFRDLTAAAVAKHDLPAEYRRVAREILRDCGPVRYKVQPGDTLSGIALHYYGAAAKWPKIYDANKATIGRNPNLIRVGATLVIPQ